MLNSKEVKARRIAAGLTLQKAADLAGLSNRQKWARLESGEISDAKGATLKRIALVLHCRIEELLE